MSFKCKNCGKELASGKPVPSGGIGVLGALGVAFVVLKLCNVLDWSWWLVTLPFWGLLAVGVLLLLATLGIAAIWDFVKRAK